MADPLRVFFAALRQAAVLALPALALACPALAEQPPLPEQEAAPVIARLKAQAATLESLDCRFIQEKRLSLFTRTVLSEGRMVFRRPASLRWEYTRPVSSGFIVRSGKGVSWSHAGGVEQRLELKDSREFAALARQILPWLAFDEEALRGQYSIDVLSPLPAVLRLTPRSEAVRRFLLHMTIRFAPDDAVAEEIRLQEAEGDSTTIRFRDHKRNSPLPPDIFSQ